MAKKKGRAARKEHRQRAEKARERGLPEAAPIDVPLRVARPVADVGRMALEADTDGGNRRRRGSRVADRKGVPTAAKVGLVALLILGVFYFVSQQRKESRAEKAAAEGAADSDRSLDERLDLEPLDPAESAPGLLPRGDESEALPIKEDSDLSLSSDEEEGLRPVAPVPPAAAPRPPAAAPRPPAAAPRPPAAAPAPAVPPRAPAPTAVPVSPKATPVPAPVPPATPPSLPSE